MRTRLVILAVFLTFFGAVAAVAMARRHARAETLLAERRQAEPVRVLAAAPRPYALSERLYGVVEARAAVDLAFPIGGRVDVIGPDADDANPMTIDDGSRVRRGDVLAQIERARYSARVEAALAALEQAEAELARNAASLAEAVALERDALGEFDRTRRAQQNAATTEWEVERRQRDAEAATARRQIVEAQRTAAIAGVRAAEAGVATARAEADDATLRAPFDGVISRLLIEPGETVSPGQVAIRIVDDSTVRLRAGVIERKAPRLRTGQRAEVTVRALEGQARLISAARRLPDVFEGEVTLVSPAADPTTGLFTVEITIDNRPLDGADAHEGGPLRPGMIGRADVRLAQRDLVVIPEEAVLNLDGALHVFVVEPASPEQRAAGPEGAAHVARLIEIRPVAEDAENYLLESPPGGEGIIIAGQTRVRDGDLVRVVPD